MQILNSELADIKLVLHSPLDQKQRLDSENNLVLHSSSSLPECHMCTTMCKWFKLQCTIRCKNELIIDSNMFLFR